MNSHHLMMPLQPSSYREWIWPVLINSSIWTIYLCWKPILHYISFFIYFLWIVVIACFLISFLANAYTSIASKRFGVRFALYLATGVLILYTHVFEAIRYNFGWQAHNYKYVAQLAEAQQLVYVPEKGTQLPPGYAYLSESGYISVHQEDGVTIIEFVTDPGLIFSYGAITYISNDRPPETCFVTPNGRFEQIEPQWYQADCWNP